jgi:glycosyltransferase involved in cell wall biosynthesis
MRIGINLLYLLPGVVGGTETYAKCLLEELAIIDRANEYVVFVNRESEAWPLPTSFARVVCPLNATSRPRRYLFEQFRLPFLLSTYKIDLVHSLGYVTPFVTPCPSVVSILDIVYDYPGSHTFFRRQLLKLLVGASARCSNRIITISSASKEELASRLHVDRGKITITLLAHKPRPVADEAAWPSLQQQLGIKGEYLLAFSSMSPSKNIPALLSAFATCLQETHAATQLVLVGHPPKNGVPLRELVRQLQLGDAVAFTGYLSDEQLSSVLGHALGFVFPSLYEGFGLPVLEAMEAGVPTACSNAASLPEVAGDAALMFDPRSAVAMTGALNRLLTDETLRTELIRKGRENARRFSWRTTAETTVQVYRQAVSTPIAA